MTDLPGRYKIEAIIVISDHVLRRSYGYIALNASELVQDPILPFAEGISGPYVSLTFERREVLKTLRFWVFGQTQCNGQNGSQAFFWVLGEEISGFPRSINSAYIHPIGHSKVK
jgi:hypothetical protein